MEHKHEYAYTVSEDGKYTASCTMCDYVISVSDVVKLMHDYSALQGVVVHWHKWMRNALRGHLGDEVYDWKMQD